MPAKSYLFFFIGVALGSMSLHYFVFRQLRRTLRKDFGERASRIIRFFAILFLMMDSPFAILFLLRHISADPASYTKLLFYPFTVWQVVMFVWALVLVPQVLYRVTRSRISKLAEARAIPAEPPLAIQSENYAWVVPSFQSSSEV